MTYKSYDITTAFFSSMHTLFSIKTFESEVRVERTSYHNKILKKKT